MSEKNIWDDLSYSAGGFESNNEFTIENNMVKVVIDVKGIPVSKRISDGSLRHFYFIEHNLVIDPGDCFTEDGGDEKKWFGRRYILRVQPYYKPLPDKVRLLAQHLSPTTTQKDRTITTGTSFTIGGGGEIGFSGKDAQGGIGVNASYTIENSETYNIPDTQVEMKLFDGYYQDGPSEDHIGVEWDFDFPSVNVIDNISSSAHFSPVSRSSVTAFKMKTFQAYQVDPNYAPQNFSINTSLAILLERAVINRTLGIYSSSDHSLELIGGKYHEFQTNFKSPPPPL